MTTRLREWWGSIPRRERQILLAAMAVALVLRLAYVVVTSGHVLAGDEPEYDIEGRFIVAGKWFWTNAPYGIPHEGMWKAPGYPVWVGAWYKLLGAHPDRLFAVQAFIGPINVALTWLLARRLFSARAGLVAAAIVAIYPLAWQFEVRMYSEALATPLTLLVLYLVLARVPTPRRAAAVGLLLGVAVLVRPSSLMLVAPVAVAWWFGAGLKRGTLMLVVTGAVAALCVAPWTFRNHEVSGAWVPVSLQDVAAYGTFNDDAAHDPKYPWAWRPLPSRDRALFNPAHPLTDVELRRQLQTRTRDYISAHPESLVKAWFWNGLSRLWDVRRPARALDEVKFEGRTRAVTIAGLVMYYPLFLLALLGLWRLRRRPDVLLAVLALALAATVVFTADSGTRYRATLEPLIVILACVGVRRLVSDRELTGGEVGAGDEPASAAPSAPVLQPTT